MDGFIPEVTPSLVPQLVLVRVREIELVECIYSTKMIYWCDLFDEDWVIQPHTLLVHCEEEDPVAFYFMKIDASAVSI